MDLDFPIPPELPPIGSPHMVVDALAKLLVGNALGGTR
jgi:hypothetical protein